MKGYDGPRPAHLVTATLHVLLQGGYHGELPALEDPVQELIKLLEADTGPSHAQPTSLYGQNVHAQKVARVVQESNNRQFLLLHRDYFGMVPDAIREGDICAVIYGARSPFILRKYWPKEGYYQLMESALILSRNIEANHFPGWLGNSEKCKD